MSEDKVRVTLEVDPSKSTTIRPLGVEMAEAPAEEERAGASATASETARGDAPDVDVDVDF